jgi:hypothetical protein
MSGELHQAAVKAIIMKVPGRGRGRKLMSNG